MCLDGTGTNPSIVFNLLHAGASYLRIHQQGFGAVGVSKKYGDRSFARYPIFWGLKKVGQLPNPDPTVSKMLFFCIKCSQSRGELKADNLRLRTLPNGARMTHLPPTLPPSTRNSRQAGQISSARLRSGPALRKTLRPSCSSLWDVGLCRRVSTSSLISSRGFWRRIPRPSLS